MYNSFIFNLGKLITLKPNLIKLSLRLKALFLFVLPHLSILSNSIHKLFFGIKKSTIYLFIGYWKIYLTLYLSKKNLKVFSIGKGLFFKNLDLDIAILIKLLFLKQGLSFFIRLLASGRFNPKAQWLAPLFLVSFADSFNDRNFKLSFFANVLNVSLLILQSLLNELIDNCFSKCNLLITSLKDKLKYCSIFCFAFINNTSILNIYLHYTRRLRKCQI